MTAPRVIPCLLLSGSGLVKTVRFKSPLYLGDPRNAVKIFNEREVDEIVILDIGATSAGQPPQLGMIQEIASEAFMPVAYGGGITTIGQLRSLLRSGIEKVILSTKAVEDPAFVSEAAQECGSQSIAVCLDVKASLFGKYEVHTHGGRRNTGQHVADCARRMEDHGAGEVILNSIDRDGTRQGYDIPMIRLVTNTVNVPVVACGGAGTMDHLRSAVREGGASAVAAGSLFVLHGRHRAVLISYPDAGALRALFS